jgi:hypothetical protein
VRAGADWAGGSIPPGHLFRVTSTGGTDVSVNVNGSSASLSAYTAGDDVRVRVRLVGSRVLFYVDYINEATPPVYESVVEPGFPLRVFVRASTFGSGSAEAKDVYLTLDPFAATVFSAAQQQQYYGGLKSPLQVRIRQHSGVREVGYGPAWEGEI